MKALAIVNADSSNPNDLVQPGHQANQAIAQSACKPLTSLPIVDGMDQEPEKSNQSTAKRGRGRQARVTTLVSEDYAGIDGQAIPAPVALSQSTKRRKIATPSVPKSSCCRGAKPETEDPALSTNPQDVLHNNQ